MDSGLQCLALLARLHQLPLDARQLQHEFGPDHGACNADDLVRAARRLGFRSRRVTCRPETLDGALLPAIARDANGEFFVLARMEAVPDADGSDAIRCLVQVPGAPGPEAVSLSDLSRRWHGDLVLLTPRQGITAVGQGNFNLRWFLPALVKYRRLFAEVLVASFFLQLFALVTPLFFQVVMDKVLVHKGFTTLDVLAFGYFAVVVFDTLLGGLRNYLFSHTTNRVDVGLGAQLFHHLVNLPLAYFESRQVGQSVARVRELETIRNFITGSALTLVIDLSFTFVFLAVMWYYSPTLTLVVLGTLPFYVTLSIFVTPLLRHRLDRKFHHGAVNQSFLTETVTGIQTVKGQALESRLQRRWEDQLADYVTASFRARNLSNIANQAAGFISKITTLLIIWCGAHLVIRGDLTVGQLVAFNMIAGRVTGPILNLVQIWQDFQQAGIAMHRVGDILNTPREGAQGCNQARLAALQGAVTLQNVRFRYRPDGPLVLDVLSVAIRPGEIVGIVGRSGSGKSTIARLIQRLYPPEAGRVLVDGIDLAMVDTAWLRRQVGIVQQDSFLFNRTVRENIAIAHPALSLEAVIRAARLAGADEFIRDLPQAYDTVIGELGCNLSGGQRQRIAIARALVANPRILVLDEATSALDYESERIIQQNMAAICHKRTVIIIAHRLSSVRHCDRIIVLDGGRVVESGKHAQLLASNGYYARLHELQNEVPPIRTAGNFSLQDVAT